MTDTTDHSRPEGVRTYHTDFLHFCEAVQRITLGVRYLTDNTDHSRPKGVRTDYTDLHFNEAV